MSSASSGKDQKVSKEWTPRMWQGCIFHSWIRMLAKNHFLMHPSKLYIGCNITAISTLHLGLRLLQKGLYGTIPENTQLKQPPVFIIGHWRTGTTLLHELLILDPRHNFPNTYQCLEPNHFLLTEKFFKSYFNFLLPSRRPMDNMEAGWDKPQEDEFALCMMGQPSPYLDVAFPNNRPIDKDAFEIDSLPKHKREGWKQDFKRFLSELTYNDSRRLVLKSPTHTARIRTLLELFPDARFIHIVRDPYVVFPSTVNLWKSLYDTHGMQTPNYKGIEEKVLSEFNILYNCVDRDKSLLKPNRFIELRYEDLIQNPFPIIENMYQQLELGDFSMAAPHVQRYLDNRKDYKTNKYKPLEPRLLELINERWGKVIDRYGYPRREAGASLLM